MLPIQDIENNAKKAAANVGVTKYDLYGYEVDSLQTTAQECKVQRANVKKNLKIALRVWSEDKLGYAETSDYTVEGLGKTMELAKASASLLDYEEVPDIAEDSTAKLDVPSFKKPEATITHISEDAVELQKKALESHAVSQVPNAIVGQSSVCGFYLNSLGAQRVQETATYFRYVNLLNVRKEKLPRNIAEYEVLSPHSDKSAQGFLRQGIEKLESQLEYKTVENGKYTVLFRPDTFLDLLSAFDNIWNAQCVLDKASLMDEDKLGTEIAIPDLNIWESPSHEKCVGHLSFDSEGVPCQTIQIIKNGVLNSFLHSSVTAKKMKAKSTGNGVLGAKVSVSTHFLHVEKSADAERNIDISSLERAVEVHSLSALHSGIKPLQGTFSLPFEGWVWENGKRTAVEKGVISGSILDVLKNIVGIGAKEVATSSGVCPEIFVKDLSITG